MIEAIKSQVLCIHPNYGALTETASNATITYDYNEYASAHANEVYAITAKILETVDSDPDFLDKFTISDRFNYSKYNINVYKMTWDILLSNIVNK